MRAVTWVLVSALILAVPLPLFCCASAPVAPRCHIKMQGCSPHAMRTVRPPVATMKAPSTVIAVRTVTFVATSRINIIETESPRSSYSSALKTIQLRI